MYLRQKIMMIGLLLLCGCGDIKKNMEPGQGETIEQLIKKTEEKALPKEEKIKYGLQADSLAVQFHNDSFRLLTLAAIADLYFTSGDKMVAKEYYLQAAQLAKKVGKLEKTGIALNNIGIIYNELSVYDSARKYYKEAIEIFIVTKNNLQLAQAYINTGIVDKNAGDYQAAFATTQKAVQILESLHQPKELAAAYTNLGNILKDLRSYDAALHYHQLSLEIKVKTKDSVSIATSLNNIGNVYRYKKQYQQALGNYFAALKIKETLGQTKTIATTITNIAEVYSEMKDYKMAMQYYNKALMLYKQLGDEEGYITASNRLSRFYLSQNQLAKAEVLALAIELKLTEIKSPKQRLENILILSELYQKSGRNELSAKYAHQALALKDSLFNEKMADSVSQQNARFNLREKDKENYILKRDKKIGVIWTVLSLAAFVLSLLVFYLWRRRRNNKFEQEIQSVRQEALNAQMSDHFISNAMDSIDKFIQNNDKHKASEYLLLFHRLIRKVLEHSFKNLISVKDELDVVNAYVELEQLRFMPGKMQFETKIEPGINCEYTQIPPMIFQVHIENAIVHGLRKDIGGKVMLIIRRSGNTITCCIEDNGMGRAESAKARKDTVTEHTSFGSSLAEKSIRTASGNSDPMVYRIIDLRDDAGDAVGTRVEFSLPYLSLT